MVTPTRAPDSMDRVFRCPLDRSSHLVRILFGRAAPAQINRLYLPDHGVDCQPHVMRRFSIPRRVRPRLPSSLFGLLGMVSSALLVESRPAGAEPSAAFRFDWNAPEECLSQQQVQAEIARLVGGAIQLHEGALEAKATVSHGPLWSADLITQHAGQTGRRRIEAPSCRAAADAVALIVALLIDPDAVVANAQAPAPEAPSAPEPPKLNRREIRLLVGIHAQGRIGTLPGADLGLGLGLGLAGSRWRTDLRWSYGLRRDQVASLPSGASGRFTIATGSATECFNLGQGKLGFGPCAGLEAGRVSVHGFGTTAGYSKAAPWLALGGGGFLSLGMGRHLYALMEVDVVTPLYRPDYVFQDVPGVVFRAPAVGGRALADLSWHF